MHAPWKRIVAVCAALSGLCTAASSCSKDQRSPSQSEGTTVSASPPPFALRSYSPDGGTDAGPNCSGGGTPSTGVDGGSSCMGVLAQSTFTQAICSCTTVTASNQLTTDGFNSVNGPPDGGLGGGVASDQAENWSAAVSVGGNLQTPGNLSSSTVSVVRGNLLLGGTATVSATLTVDGNASVVKTLPSKVVVDGTTTKVSSVAAPCDCTNLVPIASIVAAHASTNDNATIGLSTNAASGGSQPLRIDLPCGNYYLSQINMSAPLTIWAHGHTALYIGGNVTASNGLTLTMDSTSTLDVFVAGNVTTSNALTVGSTSVPAQCRMYMTGSSLDISGSATFGCNLYAPSVLFNESGISSVYGSLFVNSFTTSAATTVHYDKAIQSASNECCSAQTCDDGNPCTTDACNGDGTCSHTPVTNGTSCPTGSNLCEQSYTCQAGVCTGSNPVTCTASDPCHVAGTCNPTTGQCSNPAAANGTACNDGNACTQTDSCQSGACTGSNPVTCTAEDQCHVAGTCNPSTGQCSNPTAANGTACNDGNACTQTDTCQSGTCTGSSPVTCTASDACHAAGTCDPTSGLCSNPAVPNGTACADDNLCDLNDTCQSGVCTASSHVTCSASDACHVAGTCNPSTGTCSNPAAPNGTSCNDGNACTQVDSCQSGSCVGSSPVTCTASDQCHVAGTCNPSTGQCSNPTAANGTACNDGNACDLNDTCQAGACTAGSHVTCSASDQCHVAGTCNPSTGQCSNPAAANGTACSDGNSCTQSDSCQSGSCVGANPVTCTASDQCHVAGTCNPSTGQCSNPAAANGTTCNDGNACTQTDTCQSGTCSGTNPVACSASDQCHVAGTCNPSTGQCSNPAAANGTACNDGNACDLNDTCQSGVCSAGSHVSCTASDQCHVAGSCDPGTGKCSNPSAANGTSCNDGNACTQADTCESGVCTGSSPVSCTASDQCHVVGTCNPSTGQCSNPVAANGTSCSDGNACDLNDTCQAGVCTAGGHVTCSASDQCHVAGACDPTSGQCSNPAAANGTACNDGNACDVNDTCQAGVCTAGSTVTCGAADQCHAAGTCDPTTGTCSNPSLPDGTSCTGSNACFGAYACTGGVCTGSNPVSCPGPQPTITAAASMSTAKTAMARKLAATASQQRGLHAATELLTGDVLVVGGTADLTTPLASVLEFSSSSSSWLLEAPLNTARFGHTAVTLQDGRVLVAGGTGGDGAISAVELFDPKAGNWSPGSSMNMARTGHHAVVLQDGRVLVVGAPAFGSCYSEYYVPSGDYWISINCGFEGVPSMQAQTAPIPAAGRRNGLGIAAGPVPGLVAGGGPGDVLVMMADGRVLAAGGSSGGYYNAASSGASIFDPTVNSWVSASWMPEARQNGVGALLPSGQVLVVGGTDANGTPLTDALVYTPQTDTWSPAGNMSVARVSAAAAVLPNGFVFVDGGGATGGDLYDPFTETWTAVTSSVSRYDQTATALGSGSILAVGGFDQNDAPLDSADLISAFDSQCMSASCNAQSGQCSLTAKTDGTPCSTRDACFGSQACQAGYCVVSQPVKCDASGPCEASLCDPATGACGQIPLNDGTACNDGNPCSEYETCQSGTCTGKPTTCYPSDSCHVAGTCDPSTGGCSNPPAPDGTSCQGYDACFQTFACTSGTCTGVTPVTCTASDQCHVAGTCDPTIGACTNPSAPDGTTCDDGNPCTTNDSCASGTCAGTTVSCTASDACHVAGTCDPTTGQCSNPPAADGTSCTGTNPCFSAFACESGTCTGTTQITCAPADQCHAAGTCDPTTGACSSPPLADGTACNDGNPCTQTDACVAGACVGTNPITCAATDQCHAPGTCNPTTGTCSNPTAPNGTACNDGNACDLNDTCQAGVCTAGSHVTCTASDQCHTASCDPSTGACTNYPARYGTPCNDGNACTQNDTCQGGVCAGSAVTCTASDSCHVAGTCDPTTGACTNPTVPNGTYCNDDDLCTQSSSCQAGVCVGSNPVTCKAADQCHVAGTCDPKSGYCSKPFAPDGTGCNDGNACTQGDSCQSGFCAGTPVTCTASDQCHAAGTCDKSTGACTNPLAPNGTSCNDGNACDTNDTCQAGVCKAGGHVTCTAIDACHTASCNPTTGCESAVAPDGTACPGADKCNQRYACASGSCVGSDPVVCTASDACHVAGTCDPSSGSCSNPSAPDGTSCTDGNACTQGDTCHSGSCTAGTSVTCAPIDPCHLAGICDPLSGTCSNPAAPNGTSCGTGDAGALVCNAGTCGPQASCSPTQTLCNGVCTNTNSSASNCGACGHACPNGYACAAGNCVSPQMIASCGAPTGPIGVQFENGEVTAYVASSRWVTGNASIFGIERFVVEGDPGSPSSTVIATQTDVTGCGSNWVTGQTVCLVSGTGYVQPQGPLVYDLTGSTIDSTLVSSANFAEPFSGGGCENCGVTIDPVSNRALISEGFAPDGGVPMGAYQFLDLDTNTFEPPILAGQAMSGPAVGKAEGTSEQVALDTVRQLIVSANESGLFQVVKVGGAPAVFDNQFPLANAQDPSSFPHFDSVAEDCTTGIAITEDEDIPGQVTLVDLTQAVFTPGSPKGTWSAPTTVQTLTGVDLTEPFPNPPPEYTSLGIAPGTHLGVLAKEYGDGSFVVFQLPSDSGSGAPSMVDWAVADIKTDPSGVPWASANDPHGAAAYVSPNTGRAMALMIDTAELSGPPYIAKVDLQAVLSAPRVNGTHVVDPNYDLVAHGALAFSQRPCNGVDFDTDVSNCGACTHACASEPNAQPSCVAGACRLTCKQGTADCDGNYANGCEAVLATDVNDCGACGHACASNLPNATSVCASGACGLQCSPGYSDCDGNQANGCETHSPSCGSPNVSISGPTSVNIGDVVTFTATATDPVSSRTLSYAWTQVSGPQDIKFSAPAALTTTTTFPVEGSYVIQFEANDGFATTAGTVTVYASDVNHPSVAISGPTTVHVGVAATYMASTANTAQGSTLTFQWAAISGPGAVTFSAPNAQTTSALFSAAGTYVLQLQMSDGTATTAPTLTVTASLVNLSPVITAPPTLTVVLSGASVTATLPATVTDDGLPVGGTITASWEERSGPTEARMPVSFRSGPEPGPLDASIPVTFNYPGTYVFELVAFDSGGGQDAQAMMVVTVTGNAPCPGAGNSQGANLLTDPNNCGACGQVCAIESNSAPTCAAGLCQLVCDIGYADCDFYYGDGCEVNLTNDRNNCGTCGLTCSRPHEGTCTAGFCGCDAGYNDCDGSLLNGCETFGACGPTVSISGPTVVTYDQVAQGQPLTYVATVTDPVPGRTLSYAWTQISGPPQGTVTYSAPSSLTTLATFTTPDLSYIVPGIYVIQFEASDGYATTAASLTVTFANSAPIVTAGAAQTLTAPTMSTTLSGSVTDDGLPLHAAMNATWSQVSGPAAATIAQPTQSGLPEPGPVASTTSVNFVYPGTYVFQLAVSDTELVGTATQTVTVQAPAAPGGAAPTVSLGGVTDDEEITQPTSILGTVSDGSWVLEQRLGGRDDVQTPWTVVASGTGAVNNATIDHFDPTLMLNGIYTLRLSSTNSVGSASTSVSLSVTSRMKVGDFTLTFTDLSTQVGALPLTVTRTYDSRDKSVGDFGYGWKLGISDVRVEKSGKTGAYWTLQENDFGIVGQFCLYNSQAASVAITFPNGRQYRFTPQASPQCTYGSPDPAPDITWVSTSDPNNPTIKLVAANETSVITHAVGQNVTQLLDSFGDIWDPRQFVLTIEDGSVWNVDEDLGVTQVTDLNGNYLKITPQGILHSSGKQITFQRDDQNRITTITDPAGQSMTYAYDQNGDLATYTDRASNVTQFAYADHHYLTQIEDPLGRLPVRNEYDSSGRLLSTTDATGNTVHYTPNLSANQQQVTDRLGHVTLYTYNDRGDITQKVDATGAVWNYTVDPRGNQTSVTDPLGHTTTSTYDGADNLLTRTDALGNTTTNTYNLYRELLTTTDPLGHVTSTQYDGFGNAVASTDAVGNVTHRSYDPNNNNNLTGESDPAGARTTYQYDSFGHVTQKTDPLGNVITYQPGNVTTYQYDANGNKTQESFRRMAYNGTSGFPTTVYTYDALNRLTQTQRVDTYPPGVVSATTYTPTGKRATSTDALGRVTTYTYDALDRLIQTSYPDGTSTSQTYDAENHRISSTDASGNTTTYAYDPVGRLVRTTYADGSSVSTTYDAAGNAVQTTDELGHVTWSAYDADNRLTTTTDPAGDVSRTVYDAAGNRIATIDPAGQITRYTYDAANRLTSTTYADGSADATLYDPDGRVAAKTDTLGRTTSYTYDMLGRLLKVTDAMGGVTQYTYDETGARLSQQDANGHLATVFYYDYFTNMVNARYLADGAGETFAIDHAGEITQRKDYAGQTTTYTYDPMGRVLSRTYPDSSVVRFTYTPTGQRATETDSRGVTTYAYDSRNRLVKLTYPDGRILQYGYDAHGNRTVLTATIGNASFTTATAYDAANRPATVTDPLGSAFQVSYDADSARTRIQYPNGTHTTYGYDARHRLKSIAAVEDSSNAAIATFTYMVDTEGERTSVTEADGTYRSYSYDLTSRLTGESVTGSLTYDKSFSYDAVGNRLQQVTSTVTDTTISESTNTYAYDLRDRLTTEDATTYGYDPNGNVTSKSGEATYAWDFEQRLTAVTLTSGTSVAHQYDADGNRVRTSVMPSGGSAEVTNMLVDTAGCPRCGGGGGLSQVVAETDVSGNITAVYVRAADELLEVMRPGSPPAAWTATFVHHDGLGSVRALTDASGTTTDRRAYEAFGTKNVEAGSDPLAYGFAGEPFQSDSMLAYHRARWMDARVGRFEGMDSKDGDPKLPATLHRYVYGLNEPTVVVDPSGMDGVDALPNYAALFMAVSPTTGKTLQFPQTLLGGKIVNAGCGGTPTATCGYFALNQQLELALDYIALSPTGQLLLSAIPTVQVTQVSGLTTDTGQGVGGGLYGFVNWDPFTAGGFNRTFQQTPQGYLTQAYGGVISPAVVLAHELGHTIGLADPVNWATWEQPIVQDLNNLGFNEGMRSQYSTALYGVHVPSAIDNGF